MRNILKQGINSNMLKTIAIIAMVIDHIAFYFSYMLPNPIYIIGRYIGRIAMPIFVYLLVQGFFHTKNFKKYIYRLSIFAVITQILITVLMAINIKYVPDYIVAKQVYLTGNILFSFVIALGAIKTLHEDILVKKWTHSKNLSLRIIIIASMLVISVLLPLDYGIEVIVLGILMYYIEKFKIKLMIQKQNSTLSIKSVILNNINEEKINITYVALIALAMLALVVYFNARWTVLLALIPIAMYNGERGKMSMKYIYYITFPMQHVLLYLGAMLITLT